MNIIYQIPVPRHWDPAFDRKCCIVHNQFFWIPVSATWMTRKGALE
ncbi:WPE palindromic element domain-containing protein [Wolbachia endosymbiont of Psylliodes chrysocephala]|nr:WPE palindromic element domain-containing protein [Wolbachia endosymbiont of Psylliodes chrysocephala]